MSSHVMQPLVYTALERIRLPRPVDRLEWISREAQGKFVFDLGALDETAYKQKQGADNWLHARIARHATQVIGLDNSSLVPPQGLQTGERSRIVNRDIFNLEAVVDEFGVPELVIAGELIEHLPDLGSFLRQVCEVDALRDTTFIMSTPNACSWHNWCIGLASMESTHPDHLAIYSYKVLRTVFARNGFQIELLQPYHARFDEMISSSGGAARIGARAFQFVVNGAEWASPILSAGWIVKAKRAVAPG